MATSLSAPSCKQFLEDYSKQLAQEILEADLHIEEIRKSINFLTVFRPVHGGLAEEVIIHVENLKTRIEIISKKRRYQETLADHLESASRFFFLCPTLYLLRI